MRIVYFDYWTVGVHNFLYLDQALKPLGHETMLLHLGSFRQPCPKQQEIDGLLCRDIRYYKTGLLYKALEKIKPDVIVSLNSSDLLDRTLILACKNLHIRTVFMMHGDRAVGDGIQSVIASTANKLNRLTYKLQKGKKYLGKVIPNYLFSLLKYNKSYLNGLHACRVIYSYWQDFASAIYFPKYSEELLHDRCLIYSNRYIPYFRKLGYPEPAIKVVGNPAHDTLFNRIKNSDFSHNQLPADLSALLEQEKRYALYLEDAFVEQKYSLEWTNEYRNQHLTDIAKVLARKGYELVVKLHPSTDLNQVVVNGSNVKLYQAADLDALIFFAEFSIGHISTTINRAILLNTPVVIPQWGASNSIVSTHLEQQVANAWTDLEAEIDLSQNTAAIKKYLVENVTIMTPSAIGETIRCLID